MRYNHGAKKMPRRGNLLAKIGVQGGLHVLEESRGGRGALGGETCLVMTT